MATRKIAEIDTKLAEVRNSRKSSWLEQVNQALNYMGKKDLTSLKSIYRRLI